jgi:hypothetical protein
MLSSSLELTFIVLAHNLPSASSSEPADDSRIRAELGQALMIGDVNLFLHEPEEEGGDFEAECEVMIAGKHISALEYSPLFTSADTDALLPQRTRTVGKGLLLKP